MCGNLPSGSGKPEQTNSTNDRSSNTLNCQNKMGKTPGGRSRENSVDKKLLESKLSADGEELVDTTTQKEPHAPLLDRLAEMAEAEVHSIHRELGPALDRAELLQRKLITPSNSSHNIETKTSGEAITQSESQSETRSESRNGDAIDERQPHHAATSEPKRRPSSANRQPASTTPPPTWARQHGILPPSYPYKHYPGHPAGFHPHHSHPHAYPHGPQTHFPPPQHRANPSTPLRGAPYPPIPPHPNHVQHHHYHHYHPPPPHFGPVPHHYEPRSHHGPPYSRHHQHAFPPHIPSHSSMPPPPNPSDDVIRTKQEDAAGSKSKKSDSIKKGLPPKKRKLRQETFDAKENEPDNLEKEEEKESDLRKGTAALKITTPSCNNESDDSDGANNCEPLYKRIKNDGKNEFDQITDKRDGEDPTNETSKVNHDKRIAKKKKHEIVTPSPRGIGPDSKQSDTASALSKAVNPPSAEASEIGNSASFTSADSVPSNGNSIKTPTSSQGGSSNSMSSTPKLDDKQRKHSMQSHSAHPIYPRPSPSPHHHPHPPSWGYRGYPPPPHHGHPMSPYGKYPVGQHHPPPPIPPPPRYYSPHPHGRQHHDGGPYWHPHPHTYHNPPHHLPHRPRSILPPHVGPTPIQRNPIPMENVYSADIAVDASKKSTEITRPTLTVETEPSASKVISTGTPKSSQMSGNPGDDNASSGIQNKGKCVHIWGSMLMNFIGKRGALLGEASIPGNHAIDISLPSFHQLVNFPEYLPQKSPSGSQLSDDENKHTDSSTSTIKNCVMCGICCFFVGAQGHKSSGRGDDAVTQQATPGASPSSTKSSSTPAPFIIPRQNKGLCTSCDVKVWLVRDLNLTIKWCKGCKNFRQWAAFGDKSRATKCSKCRERQKEKYAAQKEELKQKRKTGTPSVDGSDGEDNCRSPNALSGKGKQTKLREKKNESCNSLLDAAIGLSNMMNQQTNS